MIVGNEIYGYFNYNVEKTTGNIKLFKDGFLYLTFNDDVITVLDNRFSVDVTGQLTEYGLYRVEVSEGLFKCIFGSNALLTWEFTLAEPDFINTDWDNNDFFTN